MQVQNRGGSGPSCVNLKSHWQDLVNQVIHKKSSCHLALQRWTCMVREKGVLSWDMNTESGQYHLTKEIGFHSVLCIWTQESDKAIHAKPFLSVRFVKNHMWANTIGEQGSSSPLHCWRPIAMQWLGCYTHDKNPAVSLTSAHHKPVALANYDSQKCLGGGGQNQPRQKISSRDINHPYRNIPTVSLLEGSSIEPCCWYRYIPSYTILWCTQGKCHCLTLLFYW